MSVMDNCTESQVLPGSGMEPQGGSDCGKEEYNIAAVFADMVSRQGDAIALVEKRGKTYRRYSFAELDSRRRLHMRCLRGAGIEPGDRVMLMVRPSLDFTALTFALFSMGAVVILIDPGMGYRNLLRCIESVRPDILVAIPRGILFSRLFRKPFASLRARIAVGRSFLAPSLASLPLSDDEEMFVAARDELAAIIFTTGSTGPPKGVRYTHGIFHAQLALIKEYYRIGPGEVDQPAFPLFALFSTALGARAVLPDMDPSRPAKVDPKKFIQTIMDEGVTYSFGSPAIWNVVSRYCRLQDIQLPVRKILMAGAPVSGELIARVASIMPEDGEIHTPYGATEALPIVSIEGRELLADCWPLTRKGQGVCVGRPLPGITIRIIAPVDDVIDRWDQVDLLQSGEIGEIVVRGPVVTPGYEHNEQETALAKIRDDAGYWHRMGDMGYLDEQGRLWFCGRKAHVVHTKDGPMYTICCEAIFNNHLRVARSALVGLGERGQQKPVILVEVEGICDEEELFAELLELGRQSELTKNIDTFLLHPGFPVDIRHNAKIFREKLAVWAAKKLKNRKCEDGL